jgi:hypothetical protein
MGFRRPRPRPAKAPAAYDAVMPAERATLAKQAVYIGSPDHTDIPKFGVGSHPRRGATTIEVAEEQRLKNPSCTVCPRKWARRQDDVRNLLRSAIEAANFVATDGLPDRVWARDPDDRQLVYEAKRVSQPQNGYKAYPLTSFQAKYNLPIILPP